MRSENVPRDDELRADRAALCVIDIQEKLAAAMPEKVMKGTLRNSLGLIETARVLELPVLVSEQYPNGLGRSLPVVAEALGRLPREQVSSLEKQQFACTGLDEFDTWLERHGRTDLILTGIETHVCVYQTARGLRRAGLNVFVPRDAVASRTMANWETGLQLIAATGSLVTSTEAVIFDLLKRAGTAEFKTLSRLMK